MFACHVEGQRKLVLLVKLKHMRRVESKHDGTYSRFPEDTEILAVDSKR